MSQRVCFALFCWLQTNIVSMTVFPQNISDIYKVLITYNLVLHVFPLNARKQKNVWKCIWKTPWWEHQISRLFQFSCFHWQFYIAIFRFCALLWVIETQKFLLSQLLDFRLLPKAEELTALEHVGSKNHQIPAGGVVTDMWEGRFGDITISLD